MLAVSARSRDARCQDRKGLVQDLHSSTILLTVFLGSVTFHSLSFGLLCKVEKSHKQWERHCHISFYEEYIELFQEAIVNFFLLLHLGTRLIHQLKSDFITASNVIQARQSYRHSLELIILFKCILQVWSLVLCGLIGQLEWIFFLI